MHVNRRFLESKNNKNLEAVFRFKVKKSKKKFTMKQKIAKDGEKIDEGALIF